MEPQPTTVPTAIYPSFNPSPQPIQTPQYVQPSAPTATNSETSSFHSNAPQTYQAPVVPAQVPAHVPPPAQYPPPTPPAQYPPAAPPAVPSQEPQPVYPPANYGQVPGYNQPLIAPTGLMIHPTDPRHIQWHRDNRSVVWTSRWMLWISLIEIIFFCLLIFAAFVFILGIPFAACGMIAARSLKHKFLIPYSVLQVAKVIICFIGMCIHPHFFSVIGFFFALGIWGIAYNYFIRKQYLKLQAKEEMEKLQLRQAITWCCC